MIAGLKPYPAYRDSGVAGLGDLPAHWSVHRLRDLCELRVSNVDKHSRQHEQPVRLCNYVDVYKNNYIHSGMPFMRATATAEEIERFRLRVGDLLITKDSETWNDIGVPAVVRETDADMICGYHLALLRPRPGAVQGDLLFRTLQSRPVAYQFHIAANGITRYGLSHGSIKSVRLPVPPAAEQAAIVRFLDHADRRIQRAITAKEKRIALLEEQEQAIIQQAVTGQIDVRTGKPYPAYNDSGPAWLPEVPAHWESVRFTRVIRSGPTNGVSPPPGGNVTYESFAISAIRDGILEVREADQKAVSLPDADGSVAAAYRLKAGDVLLVRGSGSLGLVGRAGMVERNMDGYIYPDLIMRVRLTEGALPQFIVPLLNCPTLRGQIETAAHTAVGTYKINSQDVRQLWLPLPPLPEQKAIAAHVADRTKAAVEHERRTLDEIELAREYRTRLIADVVTGKLDVREAAAHLSDAEVPAT